MTAEDPLWAVMIDGPDDDDVYLPVASQQAAIEQVRQANRMFRAFYLNRFATVVKWSGTAEEHAKGVADGPEEGLMQWDW